MMRRFASRPVRSSRRGHLPDANGFLFDAGNMLLELLLGEFAETLASGG